MYDLEQQSNNKLLLSRIQDNSYRGGIILLYLILIDLICRSLFLSRPVGEWALNCIFIIVYYVSTKFFSTNKKREKDYFFSKRHMTCLFGVIIYIFLMFDFFLTYSTLYSFSFKEYSYLIMLTLYTLFFLKSVIIFMNWMLNGVLNYLKVPYPFRISSYVETSILMSLFGCYIFTSLSTVKIHRPLLFFLLLFLFLIPKMLRFIFHKNIRKGYIYILKIRFNYIITAVICSLFLSMIMSLNEDITENLIKLFAKALVIFIVLILPLLKDKLT